ncbi:MAG: S8 family serine peptidase [bacterium]|nr:S8 family serine peptidase [bacterium]
MAGERLPLLRGRVTSVDDYQSPQRGGSGPSVPSRDAIAHRKQLLWQLERIEREVERREKTARDELATREIVAVRPAPDTHLMPEQLDDTRADARLVGEVAETGTVLLDVADPKLGYLRKKLDAFADDSKAKIKTLKDGSTKVRRKNERAIAPVESVGLADLEDVLGPRLRAEELVAERVYWFEIACRGGYRRPDSETDASRVQVTLQLRRTGAEQKLDEFIAYTSRVELPTDKDYEEAEVVAKRPGGISPFTSAGLPGSDWPIKPDIVMEGGNLAVSGPLTDDSVPTLCALTTSHRHTLGRPLGQISMTSEATARAARLAAQIWTAEPKLRPETVRALLVHSANWTDEMVRQFEGINDRLLACGYGVPDEHLATTCAKDRATVILEDVMPNAFVKEVLKKKPPKRPTTKTTEPRHRRRVKLYRLPVPYELLSDSDPEVELRVTLSYFAEPNKFGRRVFHGLDLKWDMQGPQESEEAFLQRINLLKRPQAQDGRRLKGAKTKSFDWDIGIQARSRGTVQSDRWQGKMSHIAGDKLISVAPVLGWWDKRTGLKTQEMHFSLVVSVAGPGVYTAIKPRVEAATALVEV